MKNIQGFRTNIFCGFKIAQSEHVWTGAPGSRIMSPLSIFKLSSRQEREPMMSKRNAGDLTTIDATRASIRIARARLLSNYMQ